MKVNIISYEPVNQWICGKIAFNLYNALKLIDINVKISDKFDPDCNINHHVIYTGYKKNLPGINTIMITHIDNYSKLNLIKKSLSNGEIGICMSSHTMNNLIHLGINRKSLTYANIPPSLDLKFKKIKIFISTRLYPDGRKNEDYLDYCFKNIDTQYFELNIMGFGWKPIIKKLNKTKLTVNYYEDFEKEKYKELLIENDYYLYMGFDEGSMGFTDAASVGLKTIVSKQGHHLDAPSSINFSFNNKDELLEIFKKLENEINNQQIEIKTWTWENYAKLHLKIWENLLLEGSIKYKSELKLKSSKLLINSFLKYYNYLKNLNKNFDTGSRFFKKT